MYLKEMNCIEDLGFSENITVGLKSSEKDMVMLSFKLMMQTGPLISQNMI
jgi:hypothetical protein